MSELYIGIDLGGTNVKTALVSLSGKIIADDQRPSLVDKGTDPPVLQIIESIKAVCSEGNIESGNVTALGICTPGPLDVDNGIVVSPSNLPHWRNFPLVEILHEKLSIPVFLDNDAAASAMGEKWLGAGKTSDNFLCVTLGTGIGGGAVVNGRLLSGYNHNALEIGHVSIDYNGIPCPCGSRGCIERYASAITFAKRIMEDLHTHEKPTELRDVLAKKGSITSHDIFNAAKESDRYALEAFNETGRLLGYGVLNAINLLNIEIVAFSGGLALAGDLILQPVRDVVEEHGMVGMKEFVRIIQTELGNRAAMLGAAKLAIDRSNDS